MAANEVDVIFRIRGDSSLVGADFANANSSIKAGEARLQAELSSSYGKYTADLRSATDVLIAESEKAIASAERVALGASQSIKNTSSALTTASQEASSFGSVVSGLAGTASIWIGAASAVFYFTEKLNQAAAQLYDLHTKVNLSVETLSALKNAAETSGSSITNLSASLGIFDKNMEKAREGQKQMSALFKSLNVDTSDNEKALRQVFEVLSKMPESEEQTAIAMQLFGRSGKDVLGVLKEMHGDLDGAIEKYRQMGTLISTETAKAADEFRDSLKQTGQSALALGRDLLETLAPALKIIIGLLQAVVETLRLVVDLVNLLLSAPILAFAENLKNTLGVIYDTAAKASAAGLAGQAGKALGGLLPAPEDIKGGAYPNAEMSNETWKAVMRAAKTTKGGAGRTRTTRAPKEEKVEGPEDYGLDMFKNLVEQAKRAQGELASLQHQTYLAGAEAALADPKFKGLSDRTRDQILAAAKLADQWVVEVNKLKDTQSATEEFTKFITNQDEAVKRLTGSEKSNYDILLEQIEAADKAGVSFAGVNTKLLQMNALLLDIEKTGKGIEKLNLTAALENFTVPTLKMPELPILDDQSEALKNFNKEMDRLMGGMLPPDMPKKFDPLKKAFGELKQSGLDAFHSLASGIGQMVGAWASGANLGDHAIQKLVASVLAGVAEQAAAQAILFTAYGIAALTPWGAAIYGPASQWFAAAALMASIAFGTAVAGRAIAPRDSNATTGAGAGGGTGPAGSSSTSSGTPSEIVADRVGSQPVVTYRVELGLKDGIVAQHFVKDWLINGNTRLVVTTDGGKV